jgi:SAC3 family protein LENG8/THP3
MVQFALKVQRFLTEGNYFRFFQLYNAAPHMSGYLLDYMLLSVRDKAYTSLVKAHDSVPLASLQVT